MNRCYELCERGIGLEEADAFDALLDNFVEEVYASLDTKPGEPADETEASH